MELGQQRSAGVSTRRSPGNTDILITHGPPRGILDRAPGSSSHAGDQELLDAVTRVKPRLHVFGHIHGAHGLVSTPDTLFANAALLGPGGDIDRQPIVVRMVRR
jgi:Icc-related predicted phosphoesterase